MPEKNAPTWSSNYLFLLASIGSTVGLSNIWKFTYLAGENGGGVFVLVYLLSLLVMGIPILGAELMIGRRGGKSMVGTLEVLARRDGLSPRWTWFGWVSMIGVFLILSFYSVIAGWTLDYTVTSFAGLLNDLDAKGAVDFYQRLLDDPARMMIGQGIFVLATAWIVGKGVQEGLERSISWMMPALFGLLVLLFGYAMVTGEFLQALRFLFAPDFSHFTPGTVLAAFGQAFFSLGIGVGVMLTYGAYMPKTTHVLKSAAIISFSDGFVSMLAGLAIFPIVFQYGLSPGEGPGLIFMTLPIAFGEMPGGGVVGALFFLLLFVAALTSSISLLESIVAHLVANTRFSRARISAVSGVLLFVIGLGTVFSFNLWKGWHPLALGPLEGKTFFGLLDYFGSNLLMPVGGILMAVIAGWLLPGSVAHSELLQPLPLHFTVWRFLIRFIAPAAVAMIFLSNLG
ncbi:MAG: sodium-dependent transporter [Cyclobacteriaceae bacterium]|nr:sodium-dependent transporter [Cyclobacteriaceae bacterium]